MHKALIFDLGKVLIPFDFKRGYQALGARCLHPEAEIRRRIAATRMVEQFEKGLVDPKEFVACLSRALEVSLEYDEFCRMWSCIFYGQLIADAVLESLARRYRMVLLSNTNCIHFQMIRENYLLLRYFDELVLSFEVHAMKPEPAIFQTAVERAGCRPEECFYTDDIGDFVEAARLQGIDAVQFESPSQLEREMLTRGISWQ